MDNVDLYEVQWRSPEWVQAFGLRTGNVLDYFSMSPFYDRSSNNQVLKMQSNFNEQLQNQDRDVGKELEKMVGIEYRTAVAREPDLWVVKKLYRRSPTDVEVQAIYFISGENIYQSPSTYNVLTARLLAVSQNLEQALRLAEQLAEFTSLGYTYQEGTGTSDNIKQGDSRHKSLGQSRLLGRALNVSILQSAVQDPPQ